MVWKSTKGESRPNNPPNPFQGLPPTGFVQTLKSRSSQTVETSTWFFELTVPSQWFSSPPLYFLTHHLPEHDEDHDIYKYKDYGGTGSIQKKFTQYDSPPNPFKRLPTRGVSPDFQMILSAASPCLSVSRAPRLSASGRKYLSSPAKTTEQTKL